MFAIYYRPNTVTARSEKPVRIIVRPNMQKVYADCMIIFGTPG